MGMKSQRGTVLVESAIYFPLVLCTVIAMLYLGLFHMQESALGYIAEQAVLEAAREEAYPGYHTFQMNSGNALDFTWSGGSPSKSQVESYYKTQHESLGDLYREAVGAFQSLLGGRNRTHFDYSAKYAAATAGITMISAGMIQNPEVTIHNGFFSSTVKVSIRHTFQVPGVIRYLGITQESYTLETVALKRVINPGEFVRNVDLADDLVHLVLRKFGVESQVNDLIAKAQTVINKILNP